MISQLAPLPATEVGLLSAQLDLLAGVVSGQPICDALTELIRVIESASTDGLLGSVLLLDDDGTHLQHCAAPSLPAAYNAAIHGLRIGAHVGSCGTAAHRREQVIVEDITTDPLWVDFRELADEANLRACWSTPIIDAYGVLHGTFALYYPRPSRPSPDDLALIGVLVRTVAMAIQRTHADTARDEALDAGRNVALTLQHRLLPAVPEHIGAVTLQTRYRTGDPNVEVAGDWFDAIDVDGGLVLVIGDVQGHDLEAAALMGQLRTVVRAYAMEGLPPAAVLRRANDYLLADTTERLATVCIVRLDAEARTATAACAGHPPPLLVTSVDGSRHVTELKVSVGTPLGLGEEWPERTTLLPPTSATLLCYTDGAIETRIWSIEEGLDLLRTRLESMPDDSDLDDLLDAALNIVPVGHRGDDVALLGVTLPRGDQQAVQQAQRWLPARPLSVPVARQWVRHLLGAWQAHPDTIDEIAILTTELLANAIRHSEKPVRVRLCRPTDTALTVTIEVFDRSHRLPVRRRPGPNETSGRGLNIVAELATSWGIREETDGKTIWAQIRRGSRSRHG